MLRCKDIPAPRENLLRGAAVITWFYPRRASGREINAATSNKQAKHTFLHFKAVVWVTWVFAFFYQGGR